MILRITSLDQFFSPRTLMLCIYIVILFVGFVYFMVAARKADNAVTNRIKMGYGLFGLTYALTRFFFLLSDYEMAISFPIYNHVTQLHLIWVTTAYSVTFVSLLVIYHTVERLILNRKPVLTVIAAIAFMVCVITLVLVAFNVGLDLINDTGPHQIAKWTLYVTGPILAVGIAALYIVIVRNSAGSVRVKSALSLIGLLLIFAGLILDMDALSSLGIDSIRFILSPALFIVGTVVFFVAQR
nr:hypothetical protein [Candidatus Sigynarchaeum springense]